MLEIILANAKIIGMLLGLYGLFFISNTMFGLYLNTHQKNEKFEWTRLWDGIKRGLILFLGIGCLLIGVSTIGTIVNMAQVIDVPSEVIDGISVVAMSTIIVIATVDYATQSIEKFRNIINKGGK